MNGFLIGKNELYKEAVIDGRLSLTYVEMSREGHKTEREGGRDRTR